MRLPPLCGGTPALTLLAWLHKPVSELSSVLYGLEITVSDEHRPAGSLLPTADMSWLQLDAINDCNFIGISRRTNWVCLRNAALP